MRIKAKYNAVIVKPVKLEKNEGNIIVPDIGKEKNEIGEIISVGPGSKNIMTGELIPTEFKVGERVILPTMGFSTLEVDGEKYFIGKENELLGVIED